MVRGKDWMLLTIAEWVGFEGEKFTDHSSSQGKKYLKLEQPVRVGEGPEKPTEEFKQVTPW